MMIPKLPTKKPITKKQFQISTLGSTGRGTKIIVYGVTGMGKTTLCSLLPKPAFVSIDGGADEILHPVTGEHLRGINVKSFRETRELLQSDAFADDETIVVDHVTLLQHLAQEYMFETIKKEKGGDAKSIESYGYHKGYRHWLDTMNLILTDCDRLVRMGKNVVLLAQEGIHKAVQPDIEDFIKVGPDLYQDTSVSILSSYMSWASHIFRISYANLNVSDKKANPVKERQVQVHGDATFYAKSRTISAEYPVVSFSKPSDASIWNLLFGGKNGGTN